MASGRETGRFEVDPEWPEAIAYAPDGQTLAVAYAEALKLWDIPGNRYRATLEPGGFWVHSLAFAPDGRTLAGLGDDFPLASVRDGQVRLYDMTSKPHRPACQLLRDPGEPRGSGRQALSATSLFTPDGRRVVANMVGTIAIWDAAIRRRAAALVRIIRRLRR